MDRRPSKVAKKFSPKAGPTSKIDSKSINPDSMAKLMFDTEGILLQRSMFPLTYCKEIMKALVYFVAYHPPSLTKNLFMEDQMFGVNSWDPCAIQDMRARNWQYVYALINRHITKDRPNWIFNNELLLLVTQKSSACIAGSLMSSFKAGRKPINLTALVIAYWIGKLYSVSIYRAKPADLPEPLKQAYSMFIKWKGAGWNSKVPALSFQNEVMHDGEELRSLFPFADEYLFTEPSLNCDCDGKDSFHGKETYYKTICDYIGEDQLVTYLTSYKRSLLEFYMTVGKIRFGEDSDTLKEDIPANTGKSTGK